MKLKMLALISLLHLLSLAECQSIFSLNFNNPIKANYIEIPPIIPFEGNLSKNTKLQNATYLAHKKLRGPETLAFEKDGSFYTGLMNGQIVKVTQDGNVTKITQIGEQSDENVCNDFGIYLQSHPECGRPLGLRLRDNYLYVADAFYGLVKIDLLTKSKKYLLRSNDTRFGKVKPKIVNDLDLDGDLIYFIDSTYARDVNQGLEEYLEAFPRGRLFRYNEKTDNLSLLLENLYFPNGIQLMPANDAILINENTMSRIIKFYLKGDKEGTKELFANIPGHGDTIRLSDKQTLLVPFVIARPSKYTGLLDLFGKYPLVRNLMGYLLNIRVLLNYLPPYGLFAEYDLNGNLLKSWHDPSGSIVKGNTAGAIFNNKLYIGSFFDDYVAVVDYE